jgi:signal peptidase II
VNKKHLIIGIIALVLIVDQWSKIWVKTHMEYGQSIDILGLSWAKIQFVENEGMAFGLSYGGVSGKYVLTIFRIFMAGFLLWYLRKLYFSHYNNTPLLVSFSLIVAGAIGNIIDCIFYGQIFSASEYPGGIAQFVPFGTGYAPLLQGKVVDMFYFPMYSGVLPSWVPVWGGELFEFFRHIFNVADSAITLGVVSLILFNYKFLTAPDKPKEGVASLQTTPPPHEPIENANNTIDQPMPE